MRRSLVRLTETAKCLCEPVPRGTVSRHSHHAIFGSSVRYKDWEHKAEDKSALLLSSLLKPEARAKVNIVQCDDSSVISPGDCLLFPSGALIKKASDSTITSISSALNDHTVESLVSNLPNVDTQSWAKLHSIIFVCCHTKRDARCGQFGPPVIEAFKNAIKKMGLSDKMLVYPISHVGRHDLAANVIVHSKHSSAWLGLIEPSDAEDIIAATLAGSLKQSFPDNWRGELETSAEPSQ